MTSTNMSTDYTSNIKYQSVTRSYHHDPQSEIQKFIPRKPRRINEISHRFSIQEQKTNKGQIKPPRIKIGPIDLKNLDTGLPGVNSPR